MNTSKNKDEQTNKEKTITGIFVDGRKDITKTQVIDDTTGRYHQRYVRQENISVTSEPDGRYLFHHTPEPPTLTSTPAGQSAVCLHEWMVEYGVDITCYRWRLNKL